MGSRSARSANTYGSGPRSRATRPAGRVTGSPPGHVTTASPAVTATTDNGARSSMRTDHGGLITTRRANAPRARGPSKKPSTTSTVEMVDDFKGK